MAQKLLMRDVGIGALVFTIARLGDEVRETYYTRVSEDTYRHHGCIQGAEFLENDEHPRYINTIFPKGFDYPLLPTLPVVDIKESRFSSYGANPMTCPHCGVSVSDPCGPGFTKCVYYRGRTPSQRPKKVPAKSESQNRFYRGRTRKGAFSASHSQVIRGRD